MRIVQLTAEFAPIVKAGGLAEVVLGLSRELIRIGHQVDVILPKYDFIEFKDLSEVDMEIPDFKCSEKSQPHGNVMWSAKCEGIPLHLLDARHPAGYFHRKKIYGCEDDTARFLYFSKAAIEYLKLQKSPIDVLHLHDWHVAAAAVFARDLYQLPIRSIILTIHNGAYQGKCAVWDLDYIGLSSKIYCTKEKLQDNENAKLANILKGGIIYSDAIVAVSPTYAKEILTPEVGYGLEATLIREKAKLTGILNGLDLKFWDPGKDECLAARYQARDSLETILKAKEKNRAALESRLNILVQNRPWVGAIVRLVSQKGPKLIEVAIERTLQLKGTFILLGSMPNQQTKIHFEALRKKYTGQPAYFHFEHNEVLAHQLYSALDLLLLPSLYEPCGLAQMIAMRYGTVPIARATGGHKDTIFDCEDLKIPVKKHNGFLFSDFTDESVTETLKRAFHIFKKNPALMHALIKNGMAIDWSWAQSVQKYLLVYTNRNK
ncbi:MAG TPA: glycogen/starch synthase [Chlamydiales bacterium]|nr:glycogen/starch synthase [Chlamydiales bacterium]